MFPLQARLNCKHCGKPVIDVRIGMQYFSEYSNVQQCPHCGNLDYHFVPSKRLPDWASLELSPSVESCGCGLGPSPVRLGLADTASSQRPEMLTHSKLQPSPDKENRAWNEKFSKENIETVMKHSRKGTAF